MFALESSTAHDLQWRFFTPVAPHTPQIFDRRGTVLFFGLKLTNSGILKRMMPSRS
jgi:hypothetical protein